MTLQITQHIFPHCQSNWVEIQWNIIMRKMETFHRELRFSDKEHDVPRHCHWLLNHNERRGGGGGGGGAARARGGVGGARKLTIASRGRGRGMSRGHGLCFGYGGRAEDGASESKDGDGTEDRSRRDDERHWSLKNSRQRGRDRDLAEEENEECAASLQRPTGQGNIESGSTSWGRELSFFYYYLIN